MMKLILKYRNKIVSLGLLPIIATLIAFFPKYNSAGNRFYSLPRSAVIRHCTPEGSEFFPSAR
jgi:hypothetical protein